ncbi:MAG: glyoxylase-like metal-dependent hydrolase (beta-lactamase superfamily II) [Glaciecola sp.]
MLKVLSISILVLFLTSCNSSLKLKDFPIPVLSAKDYQLDTAVKVSFSVIETAYSFTKEAFLFKGGKWFKKRKITHSAFLVQHPQGNFLFDTGIGSEVSNQVKDQFSFVQRKGSKYVKLKTVAETLEENHYSKDFLAFVLLSHMHWDHAGGIEDFHHPLVYTTKLEHDHAFQEHSEGSYFIQQQFDSSNVQWKFLTFDSIPYKVFLQSLDLFGDGTVVLVPLQGHTKGSIGMFLNLPSGNKYFFIGDVAFAKEAITGPSEKHFIPRNQVDNDRKAVQNQLVLLHYLQKLQADIHIIPSHDYQAIKDLAHFPTLQK